MKQYGAIKAKYPDAILLFRVGDFYETFCEDAIKTSRILNITLTRRANGSASSVELAGFPYHALDTYMPKLVQAGERVAICEQLEDPKLATSIVKRGVSELVTPGVSLTESVLTNKANNFLASVFFGKKKVGVSFLDITTGEFFAAEGTEDYVDKLLVNLQPREVLYPRGYKDIFTSAFGHKYYTYHLDEWIFSGTNCSDKLKAHFQVTSLKGFGIERMEEGIRAAGAILYYLDQTEHKEVRHITSIRKIAEDDFVWLDRYSMHNLELLAPASPGGRSLFDVIDRTCSPMGSRMLKRWISLPLKDIEQINRRLDVVSFILGNEPFAFRLKNSLRRVTDIERLISKAAMGRVTPRDLLQVHHSLEATAEIKELCKNCGDPQLEAWSREIDPCGAISEKISRTILADAPNNILKGKVIASGIHVELDQLRNIWTNSKKYLNEIVEREIEATGIPTLKIGYSTVFGYYIEVRNTHKEKVPENWIRKQTLTSAERYITGELKEYEEKILGAEDKILTLEAEIYGALVAELAGFVPTIQADANIIARIDVLQSYAEIARDREYHRPVLDEGEVIEIKNGRHPIIESCMEVGEKYIPNDLYLDGQKQQIIIITGPNMSGKSAILRQTAIITLLAQAGSFVPADSATIGIVDKIFTRVGATDNISQGESTFMVEMLESANILNNITNRSLVLLDEIGRGTSTYDGISIAWAIVEYLHETPGKRAKTLFATHYHELNEMEEIYPRIRNFNVQIKEVEDRIVFLRKLVEGGTAHSFGIHVAKIAGMPKEVVGRAEEILQSLEASRADNVSVKDAGCAKNKKKFEKYSKGRVKQDAVQLSFFQLDDPLVASLRHNIENININELTPLEALNKLNQLKRMLGV